MDSSEVDGRVNVNTTCRDNLSKSISEELNRSISEETVSEENKEVKEETLVEKRDSEHSMEVKSKASETKSEVSRVAEVVNEIQEIHGEYDEEMNSVDHSYVLSEQTPAGVKNVFVRKVLFIFIIEAIISLVGSTFLFMLESRVFFEKNWYLGVVAIGIIFIFGIVVAAKPEIVKNRTVRWVSVPIGLILIILAITCLNSVLITAELILSHFVVDMVFIVAIFFTFQKKVAFTSVYGIGFVVALLILGYGIVGILLAYRHWEYAISALAGSAIALYVAIDIRLIVNGNKREKYTVGEYGAVILLLYIDYIVRIVDGFKSICSRKKESKDEILES
nr:hypothetical protein MACL_00002523 [Theileria orientalis]